MEEHVQLALPLWPSGDNKTKFLSKFPAMLQMSLRDTDGYGECVACVDSVYAEAAITGTECSHCESMSLRLLRSHFALFHKGGPPQSALTFLPSQKPRRKKQWGNRTQQSGLSDHMAAQLLCALLSLQCLDSLVYFTHEDQCPSSAASGLISLCVFEEEVVPDDSMSLMASDAEEWACSSEDPDTLPPKQATQPSMDSNLIRGLSKAVEDLDLDWSAPEEPVHGHLDKMSLQERCQ